MRVALVCTSLVLILTACTPEKRSPDAIREDTARATSEATRDAKAVAQGVVEGLKSGGTVNINKASSDQLQSLPGIDESAARRIIDGRPYEDSYDMVKKHILTKDAYNKIAGKVTAR